MQAQGTGIAPAFFKGMNMTRKKLILILVAAGLVVAATSAAFSLYPPNWLTDDSPAGTATPPLPGSATGVVPAVPASATPH